MIQTREDWLKTLPMGSRGAEIGVATGKFSAQILEIVHPSLLLLADRWHFIEKERAKPGKRDELVQTVERFAEQVARGVVRIICAFSGDAAEWIQKESLDWIYIDADHKSASVRLDLDAWFPKVVSGGIIAGHDYNKSRGPYPAVREWVVTKLNLDVDYIQHTVSEDEPRTFWFRKP